MGKIRNIASYVQNHLFNIRGRTLAKKVVAFESDDWGSLRIPSLTVYKELSERGLVSSGNPYNRFDSLETSGDLSALCEVLSGFRDYRGNHPVITANFVMGNPNFDKIRASGFEEYHHEIFTETYRRHNDRISAWTVLTEGIRDRVIRPQYHGREHLNVTRWMQLLQHGDRSFRFAFDNNVFSIDLAIENGKRNNLMAALDFSDGGEKAYAYRGLADGILSFQGVFGFPPESFIAPCNVWDDGAEAVLQQHGVKYIQSLRGQQIPMVDGYMRKILVNGHHSKYDQIYLVRNAYFEPATLQNYDWVGNCLAKVRAAFVWNKPAIISSHRLNYIGSLSEKNRSMNLIMLRQLLKKIVTLWPDVEFISSDELGRLYAIEECAE